MQSHAEMGKVVWRCLPTAHVQLSGGMKLSGTRQEMQRVQWEEAVLLLTGMGNSATTQQGIKAKSYFSRALHTPEC